MSDRFSQLRAPQKPYLAAMKEPSANAAAITRLTLIPMSRAATISCEAARMEMPFLFW